MRARPAPPVLFGVGLVLVALIAAAVGVSSGVRAGRGSDADEATARPRTDAGAERVDAAAVVAAVRPAARDAAVERMTWEHLALVRRAALVRLTEPGRTWPTADGR